MAAEDHNSTRSNEGRVATPSTTADPVLRKRPGRVKYDNVTLERGASAEGDTTDPLLRKRPGRVKTESSTSSSQTQIDPPSLESDAGSADTAAAKKPKEIVVVGSKDKAKEKARDEAQ